jgi:hypothetical protein
LCPGIEKRDEGPGYGIEGTEIASLPTIAQRAGQGEILDDSLATVLFGDDVIHLMRLCCKFLWKQTILAAIPRPLDYLPAQLNRGARGHVPCF